MKAFSKSLAKKGVKSICLQLGCTKCCQDTEMPLSDSDISRIEKRGFRNFSALKRNGHRCLRNSSGRCVFHDGLRCTIYCDRPEGCRFYPAVLDLDRRQVTLDKHCPNRSLFRLSPQISWGVIRLVHRLESEKKRTQVTVV